MDIAENVKAIKQTLKLISVLEKNFSVKPNNSNNDDPTLYIGVAQSDIVEALTPEVEKYFEKPYKKAGDSAFWGNLFDNFIKSVGGINKDQTLYKKQIDDGVFLYCAFWPWGTAPVKTSIRIGLMCSSRELDEQYARELKGYF